MSFLALVAAFALGVGGFVWFVSRARIVVELGGGKATVTRGELIPSALRELRDVARHTNAAGRLEIRGSKATLKLRFVGLDAGTEQRIRNVLLLQRDRL